MGFRYAAYKIQNFLKAQSSKTTTPTPPNKAMGNQTNQIFEPTFTPSPGVINNYLPSNPTHHQDTLPQPPRAPQPPPRQRRQRCYVKRDVRARPTARAAPQRGTWVLRHRDIKRPKPCQNAKELGGSCFVGFVFLQIIRLLSYI